VIQVLVWLRWSCGLDGSQQMAKALSKNPQGQRMTFVMPGAVVRGRLGDHRNRREIFVVNGLLAARISPRTPHGRIML
jgi:hypothetical protein